MASTYRKIDSVTVGAGGASSIDFTNIPATYTDLVVKLSARYNDASVLGRFRFNNDTGSNYSNLRLYGTGSSAASNSDSAQTSSYVFGLNDASNYTANTFSNAEFYIPNYAGSAYKSISIDAVSENNATEAYSNLQAGLWSSTSAITSIKIYQDSGLFVQYTTATLYGVLKYAETGTGSKATGGTVTTAGGYTYHTFFSSGMFTPTASITGAEVLVVAGGGGNGGPISGGGGAGGLVYASSQSYTSGVSYAAIVGAGGGAVAAYATTGPNGTNSVFASGTVAVGGGGGGGAGASGGNGGSGGGASSTGVGSGGTATAGQGNAGAVGASSYGGGGGGAGGAGATGGTNSRGGDGGVGVSTYSAWGLATSTGENVGGTVWYAGGGGGSPWNTVSANNVGGYGGAGGGGTGGFDGSLTVGRETSGLPNTGGGAGGGNSGGGTAGGSGIIIVRYTT
jgi:hypothetical protein